MHPDIRKAIVTTETLYTDGGKAEGAPLVMIAAGAVVKDPWAGRGFVADLAPD
ncbi:amino acid synthesis family protein, partial [Pantoea sp. SIMBA_079]|uniref:amino acid synthesis family protein n=1 Tax=Pantoea sp. SIMBA_079 TaxID=3085817 RepID=UPI003990E7D3